MRRLPLAPPLLPDEALSSWIARVASRYGISPYAAAFVDFVIEAMTPAMADYGDAATRA